MRNFQTSVIPALAMLVLPGLAHALEVWNCHSLTQVQDEAVSTLQLTRGNNSSISGSVRRTANRRSRNQELENLRITETFLDRVHLIEGFTKSSDRFHSDNILILLVEADEGATAEVVVELDSDRGTLKSSLVCTVKR